MIPRNIHYKLQFTLIYGIVSFLHAGVKSEDSLIRYHTLRQQWLK